MEEYVQGERVVPTESLGLSVGGLLPAPTIAGR